MYTFKNEIGHAANHRGLVLRPVVKQKATDSGERERGEVNVVRLVGVQMRSVVGGGVQCGIAPAVMRCAIAARVRTE